MDKPELSRRKLLAGIATAGGTGAVVGTGTTALFSDEETFTNNSITASKSVSGVVDMEVNISTNETEDTIIYGVSLPTDKEGEDINNNPSHIWFRSVDCPTGQANPEVTLKISCNGCEEVIATGDLRDVLTRERIREGRLLGCSSDSTCLEPGESCALKIIFEETPQSGTTFELKFYGEQCRYNTAPDTDDPFSGTGPESCCVDCESGTDQLVKYEWEDDKFEIEEEPDPNIELTRVTLDGDDEPTEACFTTNYCDGVEAIVKAGTECKTVTGLGSSDGSFCVDNSHSDFEEKAISHVSFYCEAGDNPSC